MNTTEMGDIRELPLNEIEEVSGGLDIKVGALHFLVGDGSIVFGVVVEGIGGFGVGTGGLCGVMKGVGGGCV